MRCSGKHPRQGKRGMGVPWHAHAGFPVFENLEAGASVEEIMEWFDITREQIHAVLEFAACSLDAPAPHIPSRPSMNAHSL